MRSFGQRHEVALVPQGCVGRDAPRSNDGPSNPGPPAKPAEKRPGRVFFLLALESVTRMGPFFFMGCGRGVRSWSGSTKSPGGRFTHIPVLRGTCASLRMQWACTSVGPAVTWRTPRVVMMGQAEVWPVNLNSGIRKVCRVLLLVAHAVVKKPDQCIRYLSSGADLVCQVRRREINGIYGCRLQIV